LILDNDLEDAVELSRETLALAHELGDERTESICLNTIGLARVGCGDAGGVSDLERSVELAAGSGSFFHLATGLNNLANSLLQVGRLEESSARLRDAEALCKRYGLTALGQWNAAELVYDNYYRGDLESAISGATRLLDEGLGGAGYQERGMLSMRALAHLFRGLVERAVSDSEQALALMRETGLDAQLGPGILTASAMSRRAAGREREADELLAEVLAAPFDPLTAELPLHLSELGRGNDYLTLTEGLAGQAWLEAGRAVAAGDLRRGSEIYGSIGARFSEAWAALLAAEQGDTSRLDEALAYFVEQQATPYVQRCRALLQASA
jgi:tetratricopeptide (TPR) repeat protein